MITSAFDSGSLVVISAGVGEPCPTRLLADRIAESVCRSLAAREGMVELEVIELRRLATESRAAFFDVLEDGVLSGTPVLLAATCRSHRQSPDVGQVMRGGLARLHAEPVPTVIVARAEDWKASPDDGSEQLHDRIEQAAAELAVAMGSLRCFGFEAQFHSNEGETP